MDGVWDGLVERFAAAADGFARGVRPVRLEQWTDPTPCADWNVRQLVNHVARGNLNYRLLLEGGTAADFGRLRDADALGTDPVAAFEASARACAEAFAAPGALDRRLDHPLGRLPGRQALAVRTADTLIHTWDLARATGADEALDPGLVSWLGGHLAEIYAGMPEMPTSTETTHRFFAAPVVASAGGAQDRLLRLTGRDPRPRDAE
jgi:uncharacterized protein (TIGR03086 family)